MIPQNGISLQYIKAALWRRLWYVVIPFFVIYISSVVYCIWAPKTYKSISLILVQPQEVPKEYVRSTVTSNVKARLNTITEQIMSRSRLENIIKKYDLYPEARNPVTMHRALEKMRKQIKISIGKGSGLDGGFDSPPAFSVSFEGSDPVKVRDVTATLADMYVLQNVTIREVQAKGTSAFLEKELQRMLDLLRQKEELVRKFREEHIGLLPEQKEDNYRILAQLQQHLDSANASLQHAQDRKVLLQAQLDGLETMEAGTPDTLNPQMRPPNYHTSLSLDELRRELQTLKTRYSDRHPDVIRLAATIAKREEALEGATHEANSGEQSVSVSPYGSSRLVREQSRNLLSQLQLLDSEILMFKKDIEQTSEQIAEYRGRIERGPEIEQIFVDLQRDYEQASNNYQSLLQKKLEADLARNLEQTQKGEQFRIQDRANLPLKPYRPNMIQVLALGFVVALISGFGLAYGLEYLDPTFRCSRELESFLELPVLVSVPVIQTHKERRLQRFQIAGTVCVLFLMGSALLFAMFVLWRKNPGLLPI